MKVMIFFVHHQPDCYSVNLCKPMFHIFIVEVHVFVDVLYTWKCTALTHK